MMLACDNRSWIPLHVDDKKIVISLEYSVDITNVIGLLAKKKFWMAVGLDEHAHLMFAETIALKARRYKFHHQCRPATGTADNMESFHGMKAGSFL